MKKQPVAGNFRTTIINKALVSIFRGENGTTFELFSEGFEGYHGMEMKKGIVISKNHH